MYFAKLEGDVITEIYNGSFDFVHRITGTPMTGAVRVPDGCVQITEDEYDYLLTSPHLLDCTWDGSQVVVGATSAFLVKVGKALVINRVQYTRDRRAELEAMTEAELDAIIGE